MRLRIGLVAVGIIAVACTGESGEATFPGETASPLPDPASSRSGVGTDEVTRVTGALPDGTAFEVTIPGVVGDTWVSVSAGIVIDVGGSRNPVATVSAGSVARDSASFQNGVYLPAGNGARIEFFDDILDEFGDDAEWIVTNSITGREVSGYPVLDLGSPFDWAGDDESRLPMEVRFADFAVRRGCGEEAVGCSPARSLQVIAVDGAPGSTAPWGRGQVTVRESGNDS